MEDNAQVIFKTALLGFDKQEVLNYIDQLSAGYYTSGKKNQQQIEQLVNDRDEMNSQNTQLEQQNKQLNEQNDRLRQRCRQLEQQIQEISGNHSTAEALTRREQENQDLREKVTDLNNEIMRLKNQVSQKEESIRKLTEESSMLIHQQSELTEKGTKYDQIVDSVGVIVLEAQRTADSIVANATAQAEEKRQASEASVQQLLKHLDQFRDKIGKMQIAIAHAMESFQGDMNGMEETIRIAENYLLEKDPAQAQAAAVQSESQQQPQQ